jgi:1-deoxy-D-xylulose-5-phosphate synthase
MITTALEHDGPIAIRFPKGVASAMPGLPAEAVQVGVWEELIEGEDVLLLAVGRLVETAQKATAGLARQGLRCGVVNARWVKPLDPRLREWAARYRRVVTLEDNVSAGGFGTAVMQELAGTDLAAKVTVLGLPDRFLPAGSVDEILAEVGLDVEGVVRQVGALFAD